MMKRADNPFSLTFGRYPERYISRYRESDIIIRSFTSTPAVTQAYLIEGVRGSGKTVLMTDVSKTLSENKDWISVDLNASRDLLDDLAHRLYDSCGRIPKLLDKGFNLSIGGIGIGVGADSFQDSISVTEKLFSVIRKKNKKILITIDEVTNSRNMREFVSQFQIWLRQDQPVFLLMTGLYENIHAIQNDPALTFLLRAPKIQLEPLSTRQIMSQYAEIFEISDAEAFQLANITKGYALAFQALGLIYWEDRKKMKLDEILKKLDILLEDFAYRKIWEGLTLNEQKIIRAVGNGTVKVSHILEALSMSSGTFSKYREKLIRSGLLQSRSHGYVSLSLPRFSKIAEYPSDI